MQVRQSAASNGLVGVFFFQAEDGIRDYKVTGVQTCALPISGTPNITIGAGSPSPLILGDAFAQTNASAFLLQQLNQTRLALGLAAVTPPNVTSSSASIPSQFVGGYGQTLSNLFSLNHRQIVAGAP